MSPQLGKSIMLIAVALFILGLVIYLFHDKLHWIGRLPGDIRVEKGNTRFYFPLATMILLSLLASLVAWLIRKL